MATDELEHFRFILMKLTSIDHDPKAIAAYEDSLVKHFGLNNQESGFIHGQGCRLNAQLQQLRRDAQSILCSNRALRARTPPRLRLKKRAAGKTKRSR